MKHDAPGTWQTYLYLDGEIIQLTDDPFWNMGGAINEHRETVWHWLVPFDFGERGVKYMRRIRTGEADFDGTVGGFDRLCDCRFLDIDHDRDVDADDYALFAGAMGGPE